MVVRLNVEQCSESVLPFSKHLQSKIICRPRDLFLMFKLIEQHAHDLFHVYRAVCRNFCDQNFLTSRISAVRSSYCLGRSVLISRSVAVSLCSFIGIYAYRPVLVTHHSMWATLLLHNRKAAC